MEVVSCGREKKGFKAHLFSKRHTTAASAVAQGPPPTKYTHTKSPQSAPSRHKNQKALLPRQAEKSSSLSERHGFIPHKVQTKNTQVCMLCPLF